MSESSSDGPLLGLASAGDPGERPAEMKDELIAFLANPKAYDYAAVSVNLCKVYRADKLSDQEREIAENILRKLSKSMEASIRQSLSEHLKQCRLLPHDVASTLAHDVETVALPMIRFSQVLSDEDLVAIVRAKGEAHQVAVAGRKTLSEAVSQAVIEAGNEEPVRTLLSNQGAAISDSGYGKVIEDFSTSEAVTEAIELYSMALLRDVPFAEFESNPGVENAINRLNASPWISSPDLSRLSTAEQARAAQDRTERPKVTPTRARPVGSPFSIRELGKIP